MSLLSMMLAEEQKVDIRKVYLLKARFRKGSGYKTLWKVGISGDVKTRICQLQNSFFNVRRYYFEMEVRRARRTEKFFEVETMLHKEFKDCKYNFAFKWDGCQEWFDFEDEQVILDRFEDLVPIVKTKDKVLVSKVPK